LIKFLDSSQPQCITLFIKDPFTSDEYSLLLSKLSETVKENEKVSLLIISEIGRQKTPIDIWVPQSKEITKAISAIERIAIAGSKDSLSWAKKLFAPLVDCINKQFFSADQTHTAIQWVCTGSGILLTYKEQTQIEEIANGQKPYSQWANALLLLDKGTSIKQAAEQTGLTRRQVRYRRDRFITKRLQLFPSVSNKHNLTVLQKEKTMDTSNENQELPNEPETEIVEIEETTSISKQPEISESATEEIIEESLSVTAESEPIIEEAVQTQEPAPTAEETATIIETPPPTAAPVAEPVLKKEKSSKKPAKKSGKEKKKAVKKNKSKSKKSKQTKKQAKNKKKNKKKKKSKKNKK